MNPIVRKSMSTLVLQPSFRAVGQTQVKRQTFENPENKRQIYMVARPGLPYYHPSVHSQIYSRSNQTVKLKWTETHWTSVHGRSTAQDLEEANLINNWGVSNIFNYYFKEALSVLMLCTSVFIFTSGSSALLGRPRCGLSIWLSLLATFNTLF